MTTTTDRVIVAVDWSQLETWLTAHFSGDETMQAELDAQLHGGEKIHALNAELLYGIPARDAKKVKVNLQGRRVPAYDGGKRIGHAFDYGMQEAKMAKTFWLTSEFAHECYQKLAAKYTDVVRQRTALCDEVFGVYDYACPRVCGFHTHDYNAVCPNCSTKTFVIKVKWFATVRDPAKVLYTVGGRRRLFLGRRSEGANAVAAQHPQSVGNTVWMRTLLRLNGWDCETETPWPVVPGIRTWRPDRDTVDRLWQPGDIAVPTGTYDSFFVECPASKQDEVVEWLLWTVEQPWTWLAGRRFPAEIGVGKNWREYDKENNPHGIRDIKRVAFTATCPPSATVNVEGP